MKPYFESECHSRHFTLSGALVQTFGGHSQTIEPLPRLETLETLLHQGNLHTAPQAPSRLLETLQTLFDVYQSYRTNGEVCPIALRSET
jgi:hypothetical protein